jgi:Secretion system C-terminal sorting domain
MLELLLPCSNDEIFSYLNNKNPACMKHRKIYATTIGLLMVIAVRSQQELPASVSAEWFNQRAENIKSMEYEFAATSGNGSTKAMNRANRLAFTVQPTGYSVYSIQQETGERKWQTDFTIKGIGQLKYSATKHFVVSALVELHSYPNPAKEKITVTTTDKIIINDLWGRYFSLPTISQGTATTISINTLPAGIYFVRAGGDTVKFIKE